MKKIPQDIAYIFGNQDEFSENGEMNLWNENGIVSGGKNYGNG